MRTFSPLLTPDTAAVPVFSSQVPAAGDIALASESVDATAQLPVDVGPVSIGTSSLCLGERQSVGVAWVALDGDCITVNDRCDDVSAVMARVSITAK